jgi:hypothetical protein
MVVPGSTLTEMVQHGTPARYSGREACGHYQTQQFAETPLGPNGKAECRTGAMCACEESLTRFRPMDRTGDRPA